MATFPNWKAKEMVLKKARLIQPQGIKFVPVTIHTFKDIFVIEFYDNPPMFIDICIFFYVRHDIFYSFGLSLHFPLKLMSNHD